MSKITNISSIQVLDSRGTPTLRSFVTLDNKYTGISTVPSGASIGKYEAVELRDNNYQDFFGKSISCGNDRAYSQDIWFFFFYYFNSS